MSATEIKTYSELLETTIFPKIAEGKAILFLGAGASITEYKYLSQQIIDYYSNHISVDFGTDNIVEFVDSLIANENYSRSDFDRFVFGLVDKLQPTETHRIIARILWKEVITTNFDTLIERAYEELKKENKVDHEIKIIRELSRANSLPSNNEFRYVKLNGCASSRDQFPFVFSTQDFARAGEYYKEILSNLKNLSPEIIFISVGHSYTDSFGKLLLHKFDQGARVGKRWIYNVDPYVSSERIPYFERNKVRIMRVSGKDFFEAYDKWFEDKESLYIDRSGIKFFDNHDNKLSLPSYLISRLGSSLQPLSPKYQRSYVDPEEFYSGIEPDFGAIVKNLDVVRNTFQVSALKKINEIILDEKVTVPLLFLKGTFGAGKSTSLYRFVNEVRKVKELESIAFKVVDPERLKSEDLRDLFVKTKAKTVFVVVEKVETDSAYRSLRRLQSILMREQFSELKPVILTSIRENILERFKHNNPISDSFEIRLDEQLDTEEIKELLIKLEDCGLVSFPDAQARQNKVSQIIQSKETDILVILLTLVKDGKHQQILREVFNQLSPEGKKVLLYTALLNQHQIDTPVGLIRSILGVDWDTMGAKILKEDFLGFVEETIKVQTGTEPDAFLKIRHRKIAEEFVEIAFPTKEDKYNEYIKIIKKLESNSQMANLAIDLLKSIRYKNELTATQIDKLFDQASNILDSESHFVIHYSMNLGRRGTRKNLEKAIAKVKYVMGIHDDLQNHRLIHRRAVLAFQMAKFILKQGQIERPPEVEMYIREAIDFFSRKLSLNPDSHYSYVDYIKCEMWILENFEDGQDMELRRHLKIEQLFNQAEQLVKEKVGELESIKSEYYSKISNPRKRRNYFLLLDEMEKSTTEKPLALALKYYFYQAQKEVESANKLIPELELFQENEDVSLILFHYYGNNLHDPNFRQTFVEFIRKHPEFEESQPVYFYFYSSIRNAYDSLFHKAFENVRLLREEYRIYKTNLHEIWKKSNDGKTRIFEAQIIKNTQDY